MKLFWVNVPVAERSPVTVSLASLSCGRTTTTFAFFFPPPNTTMATIAIATTPAAIAQAIQRRRFGPSTCGGTIQLGTKSAAAGSSSRYRCQPATRPSWLVSKRSSGFSPGAISSQIP